MNRTEYCHKAMTQLQINHDRHGRSSTVLRRMAHSLLTGFCLLLLPQMALAHMPIQGMNNFYNGFLHPLFIPAQVLLLLALGFLLGQQKPRDMQPAITAFLLAVAIGLVLNSFITLDDTGFLLPGAAAIISLLVIFARPLPVYFYVILALFTGLFIGLDSAQDSLNTKQKVVAFLGSGICIYLLLLYATGFAEFFNRRHWQQTGIRILGSWIAASSLLVLSLGFVANRHATNTGNTGSEQKPALTQPAVLQQNKWQPGN